MDEEKGGTVKKDLKDLERVRGAVLALSKSSNLARFHFLCYSKPGLDPFQNPFLPLSFPVLGLSCSAYLSYTRVTD